MFLMRLSGQLLEQVRKYAIIVIRSKAYFNLYIDCATYTFLPPSEEVLQDGNENTSLSSPAPYPSLIHMNTKSTLENKDQLQLSLHGENFSRDLQVWFGDIKASNVEYRSRELIICRVPSKNELLPTKHAYDQIPILLVRGDGTICKTNKFYHL